MKLPQPEEEVSEERPSRERRAVSPRADEDAYLRLHGFRIHARPRHGEAKWVRAGIVMAQGAAVEMLREGRPSG